MGAIFIGVGLAALTASMHNKSGALSHHMFMHIVLMNLLAPGAALVFLSSFPVLMERIGNRLWSAFVAQLVLFLGWHSPIGLETASMSAMAAMLMQASLALAAFWFWACVFASVQSRRWETVGALILTGKIFCLFAALLVFSPRVLYSSVSHASSVLIADQQLAGLLMLTACPLTYLGACMWFTAKWFYKLDHQSGVRSIQIPSHASLR
ncbi:cytochrome c oxidase assembly protein [Hyphococcus sp.]|uniref:cytochrome c oxidase assembly protein n=1 Tax=Hyphococcus sp. TaxID=2038636 RepID=UPI003CCBDE06